MEAKQVAAEQSAPYVTEISFAKGSSKLTSKAQEQIKELFLRSKGQREVSDANVITWADQEYPSENAKTLSKAQRNLADNRNKAIRDYLNELRASVDVHVHSMAERPTALKEFLKTADTRVKQSLETAGIPTTDQPKTGLPKASKSIVMLMLKEE